MTFAELAALGEYGGGKVHGKIRSVGRLSDKGNITVKVIEQTGQEVNVTLKSAATLTTQPAAGMEITAAGDYGPPFNGKRYLLCEPPDVALGAGSQDAQVTQTTGGAPAAPGAPHSTFQPRLSVEQCWEIAKDTLAALNSNGWDDQQAIMAHANTILIGVQRGDIALEDPRTDPIPAPGEGGRPAGDGPEDYVAGEEYGSPEDDNAPPPEAYEDLGF